MNFIDKIYTSILTGNIKDAEALTKEALSSGVFWTDILEKAMIPALDKIGKEYSEGQAYLPEMISSGTAVSRAMAIIRNSASDFCGVSKGTIIIGTVFGDLHDIGKNVVRLNLEASGYRVVDLGINVLSEAFYNSYKEFDANIIAISCLLSTTMLNLKEVAEYLIKMKTKAKILVGGNPVTAEFAEEIGANGYAPDGYLAIRKANELLGI